MRFVTETFEKVSDIPDPIPAEFLLPADKLDLLAPVKDGLELSSSVPAVELAYVYLEHGVGGAVHLKAWLECMRPKELHDAMRDHMMNHVGRAIARVILHPNRQQLFDLPEVYDAEVRRGAVRPIAKNERPFFEHFIESWGVLKREI